MNGLPDPVRPRVAVVTGASAGIGRAIATAFGGLGWPVAVGARRTDLLDETAQHVADAGGSAYAHILDVCDAASIDAFVGAVTTQLGPIDVLVNNAGIAAPGALHEMSDALHARIVATNLVGSMLMTKRIVASLRGRAAPGDIVFVSSDTSVHPRPYLGTYGVSKSGLEAYARVLALECEDFPIRSSIVRVGPTETGFAESWDLELFEKIIPRWNRLGIQRHFNTLQPDDVARAVVSVVTAPDHVWLPVVEVQPQPPTT